MNWCFHHFITLTRSVELWVTCHPPSRQICLQGVCALQTRHMSNYFKPICTQLLACDVLRTMLRPRRIGILRPERSDPLWSRVKWSSAPRSQLRIHHMMSLSSPFPLIFHVLKAQSRSNFISLPLLHPFYLSFHLLHFPPHLQLSTPGSRGIITQCAGWRFIHYHIKGFLMPQWLPRCHCWGWVNI